ncbi:uncharacterized protein LOC143468259 [Clavelina lepadiformis]|uniref:uncharacterized protein LOC143468259 n=1 Tax=Clavelina lepadiformis TaxID=159417 RepID=UPI0040413F0C
MVIRGPLPDVVIPKVSLIEYLLDGLGRQQDNDVALVDSADSSKFFTYKQIREKGVRLASTLASLGLNKGDVIATSFANCIEFPLIVVASVACGAAVTTCNPHYTRDEIRRQFQHSLPKMIFVDAGECGAMREIVKGINSVQHIFSVESCSQCESVHDLIGRANMADYPHDVSVNPSEDLAFLPYSSGTTGMPKGVMLTQQNIIAMITISRVSFRSFQRDVIYLVVPMFHIYGIMLPFLGLLQGSKVVIEKRFSLESFFSSVQKHKVTVFNAVPPMVLAIFNSPLISKYDISSLKRILCGAAPLPADVADQVRKRLKVEIFQGYGLTECGVVTTAAMDTHIPIESIGVPAPNVLMKIVDVKTGQELSENQDGEICVKTLQVMRGYYKNPKATTQCITGDGWFHTGDIGHYDKFGCFYIVDRIKELIKYKGFQVAPAELEEVLLQHPNIADVAVIGIPNREAGEVPKAFVVKKDQTLTAEEVQRFMQGKVATYKLLRGGVAFRSYIPKSLSGKILRRELRAEEQKSKL